MNMEHIGVFTSGGDAPGMNACLRSVVRTCLAGGVRVTGILRGLAGLIRGEFKELDAHAVSNIIQLGGTVLKTSRCPEFLEPQTRARVVPILARAGIEGLVAIGGDGTFQGVHKLAVEHDVKIIGVPATIDNDVYGTDRTIGFDTAANTALESIDKIRDTAASHDRVFFIEVMGGTSGWLALEVGLSGGAEYIAVPESPADIESLCEILTRGVKRGKSSYIIVIAEGGRAGGAIEIAKAVQERTGLDYRVSILGHVQRGGAPTASDRILASRLGHEAVLVLTSGKTDSMVGIVSGNATLVPLPETWEKKKKGGLDLLRLAQVIGS